MHSIIISVHVPKTGGTSFRKLLESFYGSRLQSDYDWVARPPAIKGQQLLGTDDELREQLSGIDCIHGHFNVRKYIRLMSIEDIEPIFITWLRNPIERAASTYHFLRTLGTPTEQQPEWERAAKSMTFEQFVSETKFNNNAQVRQLRAMDRSNFSFYGCTERYTESLTLFADMFLSGRKIDNVPHELRGTTRQSDKYKLSPTARAELIARNQLDIRLYEYAQGWLDGALANQNSVHRNQVHL